MAEEEMVPLLPLPFGYEYEFISAVLEDFHCLICHLPLREPVLTRCGHRYCKGCLDEAIRRQEIPKCPTDRERLDLEKDIFPDKATERSILSCCVKCPSEGCEWTGETRYVETHLEICAYKIVTCPNSNCDMKVERRLVEDHMTNVCQWRIIHCGYCNEEHYKCDEEKHASECVKIPTDCSNGCGQVITREEIENHTKNDCPLSIISCPFLSVGCNTKVMRENMASHLQSSTEAHLALACVKLNNTQEQLTNTQVELNKTQIQLNKTQTQLVSSQETTAELMKKVDRLEGQLKEKLNIKQVNEAVDKAMQMNTARTFVWKIEHFTEVLRKARREESCKIKSEPFYTHSCGYKLQLSLYPNGNKSGKNSHLSVYNHVIKGDYDALLPWPMKITVIVTLIGQQPHAFLQDKNVEHRFTHTVAEKPKSNDRNSFGSHEFLSHDKLMRYLTDDTLFLQVCIRPLRSELNFLLTSFPLLTEKDGS